MCGLILPHNYVYYLPESSRFGNGTRFAGGEVSKTVPSLKVFGIVGRLKADGDINCFRLNSDIGIGMVKSCKTTKISNQVYK